MMEKQEPRTAHRLARICSFGKTSFFYILKFIRKKKIKKKFDDMTRFFFTN